jgi:hypothetical protein
MPNQLDYLISVTDPVWNTLFSRNHALLTCKIGRRSSTGHQQSCHRNFTTIKSYCLTAKDAKRAVM